MQDSVETRAAVKTQPPALDCLLGLSGRIGRDPLLVQASSGNASLKLGETLWIKASGKWLEAADREPILVPVDLQACLDCLRLGRGLPAAGECGAEQKLRPSIETFMHAILPQPVVIHVHSVNTIAWAVRQDAPRQLTEKLDGLHWKWIPYIPSGRPLALEIQRAQASAPETNVFVLGNHGLVVCGEDCASAEAMLLEVERRVAKKPRLAPKPEFRILESVRRLSNWRMPEAEGLHSLGTDTVSRRIAKRGVLYPCQGIFLGRTLPVLPCSEPLFTVKSRADEMEASSPFLIVEGSGVLISDKITTAECAMLSGFAEVVRRIELAAPIRYLTDGEVNSVLGEDGYHYRMSAANTVRHSAAARG
jgi:rhamnose utilization protein RhaD (predicted bifunctional aldolase and dehydrogenase)